MKTVFFTDLDNTLIYSYRHDIGPDKKNVELYEGREVSFATKETLHLLHILKDRMLIVPTTTRSREQYERIDLGIGTFPYALICNGGVLLKNGSVHREWYEKSLELVRESSEELRQIRNLLTEEKERYFELRFIEELFLFTKCHEPEKVVQSLKEKTDPKTTELFYQGDKVYALPRALNKGAALTRFREYIGADFTVAAGDSAFDISMLLLADLPLLPFGFAEKYKIGEDFPKASEGEIFSEYVLKKCLEMN